MNRNHLDQNDVHVWSFKLSQLEQYPEKKILDQYQVEDQEPFPVFFSVTKSKEVGAVALSREPVGLHVEFVRAATEGSRSPQGLSDEQFQVFASIQDIQTANLFLYKMFCFHQALSEGLEMAGDNPDLIEQLCLRQPGQSSTKVGHWAVFQFDFKANYAAAFATNIEKPSLKMFEYMNLN